MVSSTALPLIQYHASLVAKAWGRYTDPLELDGEFLRVRHLDVREELGEPWRMTLEVMTNHPQFDPSRLAGAELTLHMLREDQANPAENDGRFFHGVVTSTEYIGAFGEAYRARLLVAPSLALLDETRRSRVFQDATVVEIVQQVAEDVVRSRGGELDVSRLVRDYAKRDYCVQYGETDLAFVQRVLSEEGITVAFEADASHERTVLYDEEDRFASVLRHVEGLDDGPPPQTVPVRGDRGELADLETIASFTWHHRVHAGHGELEQWDWKQASPGQLAASLEPEEVSPRHIGSFYVHGERRLQEDAGGDGPHLDDSVDRLQRAQARVALEANVFDASSNVMGMAPAATFELDGHPDTELNGPYYCIRATHVADNDAVELGAEGGSNYDNVFTCASVDQAYVPTHRARPRIFGVQTATVVGPEGEEIHTDAYGRIKVRMHWDREQRDRADDTSCWLRVAHSWAGAGFGTQFIPRVGMEVLVSFLGGDPDRPVCVGAVYNGSHTPPYGLPDNKTQSGIKTQSTPGGEGFNELRFEDAAGKEEVYFHAQRNHTERVLNEHSQRVGATQSVSVGSDQTTSVGGKREVNVTGDQSVTIGAPPPPDGEASAKPSNHTMVVEGDIKVVSNQKTMTLTAPQSISLKCGSSSIVLTPSEITITSGTGAAMTLNPGLSLASAGGAFTMDMDDGGTMTMASIVGSSFSITDELIMKSASQSELYIDETISGISALGATLRVDGNVTMQGNTVSAKSTTAGLELSTGLGAYGATVEVAAQGSKLELTPASAKLTSATVDIAGLSLANLGAPNVKIN